MGKVDAQLHFKLQLMQDDTAKWGVYMRLDTTGIGVPGTDGELQLGSGQVTLVAPNGFMPGPVENFKGTWTQNARVNGPTENPDYDYISYGWQVDFPKMDSLGDFNEEILLFTIERSGDCPDTLYLIDNGNDPFDVFPNSAGTNPGNDLSIYDFKTATLYNWSGNYAPSAWSCHDCDTDGYLNAIEDNNWDGFYDVTDGNGMYDAADTTGICDPCDPIHPVLAEMYGDTVMCSVEDDVPIYISTEDWHPIYNWEPYTVVYQDKDGITYTVNNYVPGDPIIVSPSETDTFTIVSMTDTRGCSPDTIRGSAIVTVEGPISITDDPDDIDVCYGDGTTFSAASENLGSGAVLYNWQISTDNITFVDLDNGTPYTGVYTTDLQISNVAGLNDLYYRVKIFTSTCDTVFSGSAQLNVEGPITIDTHPVTHSECSGNGTTFTAAASAPLGTLTTVWQISTDGGASFTDLADGGVYSGTDGNTLTISDVTGLYNNYYRLAASTPTCNSVFSNAAQLLVEGPITIDVQPVDHSDCSGKSVNFIVQASMPDSASGTIRYQWQMSSDSTTWTNLANDSTFNGVRTDTLSVDISDSLNGSCFRVNIWTTECNVITSDEACLSVSDEAEFDFVPQDTTICDGGTIHFLANATVQQGSFTYHWQVDKNDGAGYVDLADGVGAEGATYDGVDGDSLSVVDVSYLMNNFTYRVEARTADCNPVASTEALLTVEGPLSVVTAVENDTVCRGEVAVFEVEAGNLGAGTLEYQWEYKRYDLGVWLPIPNSQAYGGVNTNYFTLDSEFGGNDGDSLRVVVSTPTCASIISNAVRLTVEGPLTFTDMPNDTVICSGGSVTFTSEFGNENDGHVEYIWERSDDFGIGWVELNTSAIYTDARGDFDLNSDTVSRTLTITDVTGYDSTLYRLKIRTGDCEWEYSDPAWLFVEGPLSFDVGGQPDDVTLCATGNAKFFVDVVNNNSGTIMYQWQIKNGGVGAWTDLRNDAIYNGVRSDTLNIAPASAAMDGDSVRVLIFTGTCGSDASQSAVLRVEGPVTIDTEAQDTSICSGSDAAFEIAYTNPGAGTPTLMWQVSIDGGASFNDVPNAAPYSNITTTQLVITGADSTYNEYQYRVAYTLPTCGTSYTDPATLFVEGPIHFTNQPDDVTTCDMEDVSFQVSTSNGGAGTIEYQWQRSQDNGTSWQNLTNGVGNFNGVNSPILSLGEVDTLMIGDQFRVIISTGQCATEISSVATLDVEGPLWVKDQPDDAIVCSLGDTTLVVDIYNGGSGTTQTVWEYSTNEFGGYTDVPDNADFDDVTTETLVINDVSDYSGYYFRVRYWAGTCPPRYTEAALLTVEGPLTGSDPVDVTVCNANSAVFNTVVTNPGAGTVNYQWEVNRGSGWEEIPANDTLFGTIFNGVRSDTLSVSDIIADSMNNAQFRVRYWSAVCNSTYTNAATLSIEGPLEITDMPDDTTVCAGEPAFFEVTADAGTGGTLNYQWEVSTNGTTWVDATGGVYSGDNTARLDISDVANLYNRRYRVWVWTGTCDPVVSDMGRLTVEGPVEIVDQPDSLVACQNQAYFFDATVVNNGAGTMSFQWEVLDVTGGTWSSMSNSTGIRGVQTTVLQLDSMPLMRTLGDTVFRLRIDLPTCSSWYSDTVLLHIVSDTLGFCDFDLDGEINDIDLDDDNDGLDDVWEYSCMHYGQFNADVDMDGDLDGEEDWDGDQIINSEETDGDGILDGDPCDPCDPLISIACFGIQLDIKVNLFGAAYNGNPSSGGVSTLMRDKLREQDLIPTQEPYSALDTNANVKFTHVYPGGSETVDQSVLDVTGNDAVVDWVYIELRSANKIDSIVATRAALLQADGDVVDTDGVSPVDFGPSVQAGEHFVAIRHRNHLGAMTIDAPELSPTVRTIDFRDASKVWHGDYPQRKIDDTNQYYLWAGDMTSDGRIIYQGPNNDVTKLFLDIISDPLNTNGQGGDPNANHIRFGYLRSDFNMDGRSIYQGPNNDRTMLLIESTLKHNSNTNRIANYIIVSQLP
jgi:hypothetical protein